MLVVAPWSSTEGTVASRDGRRHRGRSSSHQAPESSGYLEPQPLPQCVGGLGERWELDVAGVVLNPRDRGILGIYPGSEFLIGSNSPLTPRPPAATSVPVRTAPAPSCQTTLGRPPRLTGSQRVNHRPTAAATERSRRLSRCAWRATGPRLAAVPARHRPTSRANRSAVSGATVLWPRRSWPRRCRGTPSRAANADWLTPSGLTNASSSLSPGGVGGRSFGRRSGAVSH